MSDAHDNTRRQAHLKAAEQHTLAAQSHRTAAEHNEKGDEGGKLAFATSPGILGSRLQTFQGKPQQVGQDGDRVSYV